MRSVGEMSNSLKLKHVVHIFTTKLQRVEKIITEKLGL
jgi:hypothetical protein